MSKCRAADDDHACLRDGWPFAYRGTVVCLLPKVASTAWKLVLLKDAGVRGYPGDGGRFDSRPHGVLLPDSVSGVSSAEWSRLVANGPGVMIVRNPFTRLLSGYLDKVGSSTKA